MKLRYVILATLMLATPANAIEARVRAACAGDYFQHCFGTKPGSAACKACFKRNGHKLSNMCKNALRSSRAYAIDFRLEVVRRRR